jgi:hypothetical protein
MIMREISLSEVAIIPTTAVYLVGPNLVQFGSLVADGIRKYNRRSR